MSKRINHVGFVILSLLLLLSFFSPALAAPPRQEGLTLEALQNATYQTEYTDRGAVQLVDGEYRETFDDTTAELVINLVGNMTAFGDLNGDGVEDAAAVLLSSPGGSGAFFDLAAVINQDGQPLHVATKFLGDRVELQAVSITGAGEIEVERLAHGPDDPFCCPTVPVTQSYYLLGDKLVQVGPLYPYTQDGILYGYVDLSGEWVIDPQFDFAQPFAEGLAVVSIDEKYGYVDRSGELVIAPRFDFAESFSEVGLAPSNSKFEIIR